MSEFNTADTDISRVIEAVVSGERANICIFAGEKHDPVVSSLNIDADTSVLADLPCEFIRIDTARLCLDPKRINDTMEDLIACVFDKFDGGEQDISTVGGDALMAFDAPVAGVSISRVAEAD